MKLKNIAIALTALAAVACSKEQKSEPISIDRAENFADSVSIAVGNRLGLVALFDVVQNVPEGVDKEEMLRGAMTVMNTDTANISYIYGLAMGEMLMRNYRMLASRTDVNKDLFINAVKDVFMLDELPDDAEVNEVIRLYNAIYDQIEANERAAADAKVFDTEEAKQNRMLGEAVEAKLKADPDFQPLGDTAILVSVATLGDGTAFEPGQYPVMDITLSRADSGQKIIERSDVMIPAGNCNDALMASLLPYLSAGETATFYVPYQYAYGVQGLPQAGIGPCEGVMATITVKGVK